MAGQYYGRLEGFSNTASKYTACQEVFVQLYNFLAFLETQNVCTLRALYYGSGGTGTNFWDVASPFTSNAWMLWEWRTATTTPANPSYAGTRNEPFYLYFHFVRGDLQVQDATILFSGAAGVSTSLGIGVQMAVGIGGDKMPWNGTLGTFGTPSSFGNQTRATQVWKVPTGGTGVLVFPRSNNTGGNHNTNKQNCLEFIVKGNASLTYRYQFIADHDSLMLFSGPGTSYDSVVYTGVYQPRAGLTPTYPYVQFRTAMPVTATTATVYGDTAGTVVDNGGVAFPGFGTPTVLAAGFSRYSKQLSANYQPNRWFATPTYEELPLAVQPFEVYGGLAGTIPIREVFGPATHDTNTAITKCCLGTATAAAVKFIVPWRSTVTPGSATTRTQGYTGTLGT